MKNNLLYRWIPIALLLTISLTSTFAQSETVSPQERSKLRAAAERNPNDLEAQKAYLNTFVSADDAKTEYEVWMKKYPKSAAIPQALGEKYGTYSPKSGQYLLKAAELQPSNVALWQKLALDASLRGNYAKEQEYTLKAVEANPENLNLQWNYFRLFKEHDEGFWKQKTWEMAKKHPNDPASITALHIMGYDSGNLEERIEIWEGLRNMVPKEKIVSAQVAMSRLADAYIQAGQYAKAVELSQVMIANKAEERASFPQKVQLAKTLLEVENKIKEGKYAEAKSLAMPLNARPKSGGSRIALVKASSLDAAGDTQAAYDSLIVFQATTPYKEVKKKLETYGSKLGRSIDQVKKDVRVAIARNSRPATPFELDEYTSDQKMKLADLKGKVVMLSFWFPGCGPCRGEMPHVEAAIKNIDRSKFAYLGVNSYRDQDDFVLPFMKGTKYSFTPLGADENVTKDYGVRGYPSNFIIDQEGRIAYSGFLIHADSEEMLELMIQSLL